MILQSSKTLENMPKDELLTLFACMMAKMGVNHVAVTAEDIIANCDSERNCFMFYQDGAAFHFERVSKDEAEALIAKNQNKLN